MTVVGRRADLGEAVARRCAGTGQACHFVQADVGNDGQVAAAVESAVGR